MNVLNEVITKWEKSKVNNSHL